MSAKTTASAGSILEHFLNNLAIPNVGDGAGLPASAVAGDLYASLHSADPGVGGIQTTNELSYTGYTRVAVPRDGTQWNVVGASATNLAAITFPACAGGSGTALFVGIGLAFAGGDVLLYRGTIVSPVAGLAISPGITPVIQIGSATITES